MNQLTPLFFPLRYPADKPLSFQVLPERLEGSSYQAFQVPERKIFYLHLCKYFLKQASDFLICFQWEHTVI